MKKVAIMTDSNSGITQSEGKALGIFVLPMPFNFSDETFLEDINLTQEEFYQKLGDGADISTSQPSPEDVINLWDQLLKDYDQIVHIPMSSGLSSSCDTATMLAADYEGKVFVVNNQRISVTLRQSVMEAISMAEKGYDGAQIKKVLEDTKFDSSIYITVDTLKYLKKGGRITPAAAALGTLLRIKPVLQIQGGKLDAFAKARTMKQAKMMMINAIKKDFKDRFGSDDTASNMHIFIAHTANDAMANELKSELETIFPGHNVLVNPLSLSVACHIGPGALAIACTKKLDI
ncbi:MAG TPA: DegV family protein [Candidatus Scybalocola faecipullorum]|nr:DegV family protein [Candidatus Scybalocola faecipullorum]